MPFASVIVPIYNQEPWLEKCLDSLEKQTDRDFEVLLIDDGSTDGSMTICGDYVDRNKDWQVFHFPNGGLPAARNRGMRKANGRYITFLDADDAVHPQWIELLHREADASQRDLYFWGMIMTVKEPDFPPLEMRPASVMTGEELFWSVHKPEGEAQGYAWNKAYRREILQDVFFDEQLTMYEDVMFCSALLAKHRLRLDVGKLPYALHWYRQRENSMCSAPFSTRFIWYPVIKDRTCDLFQHIPVDQDDYRWLQNDTLRLICIMQEKLLRHHLPDGKIWMTKLERMYKKYRSVPDDGGWDLKLKVYRILSEIRYRLGKG